MEWVSEDWMRGRVGKTEGIFPVNFVKVVRELPRASAATNVTPAASTSGSAPTKSGKLLTLCVCVCVCVHCVCVEV